MIADQDRRWPVAPDAAQQTSCNGCQSAQQTGNGTAHGASCCLYLQATDIHATVAVPATIILATTRHCQAIPTTVAFCCGITFVRELSMRQALGAITHGTKMLERDCCTHLLFVNMPFLHQSTCHACTGQHACTAKLPVLGTPPGAPMPRLDMRMVMHLCFAINLTACVVVSQLKETCMPTALHAILTAVRQVFAYSPVALHNGPATVSHMPLFCCRHNTPSPDNHCISNDGLILPWLHDCTLLSYACIHRATLTTQATTLQLPWV